MEEKQPSVEEISVPQKDLLPEETRDNSWKSEQIGALSAALSMAQSEMKGAAKNMKNDFFGSGYADLHSVIEASFPYLNKHGLSVVQGNEPIPGHVLVTTTLLHRSGQWMRSKVRVPLEKTTAHGLGSAITYGRRYGLSAMVGIAQMDDDGNSISNLNNKER